MITNNDDEIFTILMITKERIIKIKFVRNLMVKQSRTIESQKGGII